jgi:hypothetical protein
VAAMSIDPENVPQDSYQPANLQPGESLNVQV